MLFHILSSLPICRSFTQLFYSNEDYNFMNCQLSVSISLSFDMNECIWSRLQFVAFLWTLVLVRISGVSGNAAIITSVNYAFETFSPYALIRFFEFSDKEWNITGKCFKDMYVYVQGLRNGEYWAVKCMLYSFKCQC